MRGIEQYLQVDAATLGALKYQGTWDASTNTPTLTSSVGVQGQYYVVSVAGSTNLNGETNWQVGDWAVFNGSVWQKVDGGSTGLLTTLTVTGNTYLATTSGDVGVATTSPGAKLDVVSTSGGTTARFRNVNTGNFIDFYETNTSTRLGYVGTPDGTNWNIHNDKAGYMAFDTNNTERMRITSAGDVGIGTSSPGAPLQVGTANANAYGAYIASAIGAGQSGNGSRAALVDFGVGGGLFSNWYYNSGTDKAAQDGYAPRIDAWASDGSIRFSTSGLLTANSNIAWTERARIDTSGNLGLGVTPSAWFSDYKVLQIGLAGSVFNDNYNEDLNVGSNTYADTRGGYKFIRTGYAQRYVQTNGGQHQWLTSSASGTAGNAISFTQAMTLDASGNLGLGVTPSASWAAGTRAIQFGPSSALYNPASNSRAILASNAIFTSGASAANYITSNAAAFYDQDNGTHKWHIAPSGTAGNAISFTQAMTLDASGNVQVGTTTGSSRMTLAVPSAASVAKTVLTLTDETQASVSFILHTDLVRMATGGSDALAFETNGAERARITSGGDLLVGTTSNTNTAKVFSLATASGPAFACQGYSGDVAAPAVIFGKYDNDSTTSQIFVRFTINNNSAGSGQINANGASAAAFGSYSDVRLKENISNLPSQLGNICALRPVEFDYKDGSGHQIGFVAQEMQQVYPDVVAPGQDEMLMVTGWSKTEARLVKAIQEQQAIIESLKARLDAANL